ncbi:MAG: hypothetical protein WBI82_16750 [Sphaerochaeta sp.]
MFNGDEVQIESFTAKDHRSNHILPENLFEGGVEVFTDWILRDIVSKFSDLGIVDTAQILEQLKNEMILG